MALHPVGQLLLLRLVAVLEELLHDVVAEDVRHQLQRVGEDLPEELRLLVAVGGLQLALDEARAVLVAAELDDVVVDVLRMACQFGAFMVLLVRLSLTLSSQRF